MFFEKKLRLSEIVINVLLWKGALPLILCKQRSPTILPPTEFYINPVG